ncbi:hypothetical protein AWRI1631_120840 [Saccharomyces cerevisiae AWRI1631]|uniref:Uncharacterized protein n=1 Tax=Saccharomyces cerevisiae (strain AWRI1631) TaxID=545124 RepID=B5VMX2_YEAS6|nr:hypothetical protein AWRI1631_120840 [Saccharomyces cerevisiae AWRI1631]
MTSSLQGKRATNCAMCPKTRTKERKLFDYLVLFS